MTRRRRRQSPWSLFAFQDIITSVTGIVIFLTLMLILSLVVRPIRSPSKQSAQLMAQLREALETADRRIKDITTEVAERADVATEASLVSATQIRRDLIATRQQIKHLENEIRRLKQQASTVVGELDRWRDRSAERDADRRLLDELLDDIATIAGELEHLRQSQRIIYNPTGLASKVAWLVDLSDDGFLVAPAGKVQKPLSFTGRTSAERAQALLDWADRHSSADNYFVLLLRPSSIATYRNLRERLEKRGFSLGFDLIGSDETIIDSEKGAGI